MLAILDAIGCICRLIGGSMASPGQDEQQAIPNVEEPSTALPQDIRAEIQRFYIAGDAVVSAFVARLNAEPVPPTIYHYTDWAGFRGILETGILRFGDIFYLNDPSELRHGVESALAILDEIGAGASERPELAVFAKQFRRILSSGIEVIAHYFVCCFSQNGDDLGQWRAYADNGRGYAIGFDGPALVKAFSTDPTSNGQTFRITYSDEHLQDMHRRLIDIVVPFVSFPRGRNLEEATLNQYMLELQMRLALLVLQASILFKHRAYTHEDEYRLLQIHRTGRVPDVRFRDKPYTLARYREFNWRTGAPGAVQRIMIGPAADADAAERFAMDCLRAFHPTSEGVDIEKSRIPYKAR